MFEGIPPDELANRGMLAAYDHPSFGAVRSVGLPLTMGGFEPTYSPGPRLGADGDALLRELGYAPDAIAALRAVGAFGVDGRPPAVAVFVGFALRCVAKVWWRSMRLLEEAARARPGDGATT